MDVLSVYFSKERIEKNEEPRYAACGTPQLFSLHFSFLFDAK